MAGPNGTDELSALSRAADYERRHGDCFPRAGLIPWAEEEIVRLRRLALSLGERVEDLEVALEAAKAPQCRLDLPHAQRGPHSGGYPQAMEEPPGK